MSGPDASLAAGQPPPAEVEIDEGLVRCLLELQHPDLAELPLRHLTDGWDNVTYRLGDDLAVRLPRRAIAAGLFENEQRWLPVLARRVRLPVPEPVRSGTPAAGYPWSWSVVRWIPGVPVAEVPLDPSEAGAFGAFLADLHGPAPDEAPRNPYRGVPLHTKEDGLVTRWDRLAGMDAGLGVDIDDVRRLWADVVGIPIDSTAGWLHGDLHPKNVVGDGGRLAGIIDWGDLGVGDPATDLGAAWMLFPPEAHEAVWAAYEPVSAATRDRARGWAVFFGTVLLDTAVDGEDPFGRIGRQTLTRAITRAG